MDTEHSYYARVLDEVERLQPVGAGGGILVLNLMYPCFEPGARVGMALIIAGPNGWACFGTRILIAAALQ